MASSTSTPEVVCDLRCPLGEGALWDHRKQVLYWVDILSSKVFEFNPKTNENKGCDVGSYVGTVVTRNKNPNQIIVATRSVGVAVLDLESSSPSLSPLVHPNQRSENRYNDGKCDPQGRFWVGTMHVDPNIRDQGSLFCISPNLSVSEALSGVSISNGIVWSSDSKKMFYIDTPTGVVFSFDFLPETGEISNKQIAVKIPEGTGHPDGMAIDEEGMIWVAHWAGSRVCRYDPTNGKLLFTVSLPVSQVTSCAWGGEKFDELYITSARTGLTGDQLVGKKSSGFIFRSQSDYYYSLLN
eukprot:TRINITY_DN11857_c0_g1_i1.p1 TRINITY_DN11857_c0_g1~~TRINITY_DN11857_c0_g1_i1.p1  ORF type:complete len:297 (+),score=80.89 TRINITY_DN11857_c0_g1_i1:102-992(+)